MSLINAFKNRKMQWSNRKRNTIAMFVVMGVGLLSDLFFRTLLPHLFTNYPAADYFNFASELWLGLIAIVLGTLIIVISIASQSTPKLISFFIGDFLSLLYSWGLIFGLIHSFYSTGLASSQSVDTMQSVHVNMLIYLPLAALAAFPYILYILNFTKKSRIIRIITNANLEIIRILPMVKANAKNRTISKIHVSLFRGLNSLDDLFEYVSFKEPRSEILSAFSELLSTYISEKSQMPHIIFKQSSMLKRDIAFRGLHDELNRIQETRSFYEFKTLHIMSDIYLRMIKHDEYQLASQCGKEISDCGKVAILMRQDESLNLFFVTMNTLIRFSLKHGLRTGEVRNTYNLLFHYSALMVALVESKKTAALVKHSKHLSYYGTEISKYVVDVPSFIFLVDIVYLEFNKIIQAVCEAELDDDTHIKVLEEYLHMCATDKLITVNLELARQMTSSNTLIMLNLGLYYIHCDHAIYVDLILTNIRNEMKRVGMDDPKTHMLKACDTIEKTDKEFWETTDRGNENIYYSPHKEHLNELREIISRHYA
jgi:hypothetical protein